MHLPALTLLLVALLVPLPAGALTPELADLDLLPLHVAPAAETAKAIAAAQAVKGSGPALFAVTVPLPLALADGLWDEPQPGFWRWRTRVYSADARTLLMAFGRFRLPGTAQLWIYDAQGRTVQGPYTATNHSPEGSVWTAIVPGDTAVIELQVPADDRSAIELTLDRLGHGYKNVRDLGESGGCNIDTACPLGNGWRSESRAAVKLQIPAGLFVGLCSGTLVNNTRQNDRPFVLTADHCGIGTPGSPASGVVTYWNFANSSCGVSDATDTWNQTGAMLRADDRDTDLTLIELTAAPSPAFNVYFAGWDAGGSGGSSGVGIHHPSGDARKISEFTTPLVATTVQIEAGGPQIPAWRVTTWSQGTTEQGSSGSGLWNQNRQIVGVLSGGSAACNGSAGNGEPDFYARLASQWTAQAATAGQLKAWLDPGNSGCLRVPGKNPGAAAPLACEGGSAGGGSGGGGGSLAPTLLILLLIGGRGFRRPLPQPAAAA